MKIDKWVIEEAIDTLRQANISLLGITGLDTNQEISQKIKANESAINRRIAKAIALLNKAMED